MDVTAFFENETVSDGANYPFKNDAFVSFGLYGSSLGTLSPSILVDLGGLQFGFNYDLELARISRAYRSSLEFTLSYAFTKNSLFKKA